MTLDNKVKNFNPSDLCAVILCAGIFLLWLNFLFEKFISFGYYDWDLAIYANAMWALTQGSFSGSLWGINFLANHAEYISLLIVPIYWLFPGALTLIALKVLSLTAGGFVLYLIGKEKLGGAWGLLLMLLYFAFPANFFMLIFEFHFESLAIVFLFLVYYYLHVRVNYKNFVICCILASLCKENIPPVIFMFGFMHLFQRQNTDRKFAFTAMGIGAGIFILAMFVITPILRHTEGLASIGNPYIGLYWSGQEKLSVLENLTTNIQRLLSVLFSKQNNLYIKDMFLPFLFFTPFLGFKTLLVGLPLFLQALLSNTPSMHTIYYHYAATAIPFVFLAAMEGILLLRDRFSKTTVLFLSMLLILTLGTNSYVQATRQFKNKVIWKDPADQARWALLSQIPSNASVTATFEFLSHLANRKEVYPLRNLWNNMNIFKSSSPFVAPKTQYALIDFKCNWLAGEVVAAEPKQSREKLARLKDFYFNNNWQVQSSVEEITLLKKKNTDLPNPKSLAEIQKKPFAYTVNHGPQSVRVNKAFELLNTEIHQDSFSDLPGPLTALTFYWKANETISDFYIINIGLVSEDKVIKIMSHHIGYVVYPTALWQQGDYIKETYWFDTASLPKKDYLVFIAVKNLTQDRWQDIEYQTKKAGEIQIATITVKSNRGELSHEK